MQKRLRGGLRKALKEPDESNRLSKMRRTSGVRVLGRLFLRVSISANRATPPSDAGVDFSKKGAAESMLEKAWSAKQSTPTRLERIARIWTLVAAGLFVVFKICFAPHQDERAANSLDDEAAMIVAPKDSVERRHSGYSTYQLSSLEIQYSSHLEDTALRDYYDARFRKQGWAPTDTKLARNPQDHSDGMAASYQKRGAHAELRFVGQNLRDGWHYTLHFEDRFQHAPNRSGYIVQFILTLGITVAFFLFGLNAAFDAEGICMAQYRAACLERRKLMMMLQPSAETYLRRENVLVTRLLGVVFMLAALYTAAMVVMRF